MRVGFEPSKHGYQFSNNFIKWSYGPASGSYLCGGMAYSAIDYWIAGLAIPQQSDVPQIGDALQATIQDRQMDAHGNTIPRFVSSYLFNPNSEPQWQILDNCLRRNKPIPVCLYKTSFHGHHTVAYAVDLASRTFEIYDPNYPRVPCTISPSGSGYKHSREAELWSGFFVDTGYEYQQPPMYEGDFSWLRCLDCRLLFKPGSKAICPKNGGAHNSYGSAKYVLSKNAGSGQSGWKMCWKCGSLFYGGDPSSAGLCPDGGIHNPQQNTDYTLSIGGVGQGNWRRCIYCDGLFWLSGGGKGGVCPGGGMHESDLSKMYNLPMSGT
jgi:hypothetical protein